MTRDRNHNLIQHSLDTTLHPLRDLLQIEDISTAIKRLSLQATTPGTDSSRNSPLNSDRSTGELRGIQFELDKLAALPSPKTTSQV